MKKTRKNLQMLIVAIVLLLGISCTEENLQRFGFDSPFNKNSTGLVLMHVDKNCDTILLEGEIFVKDGGIELELINPVGVTEYAEHIKIPTNKPIRANFIPMKGFWKLKYTSLQGIGTIDLHLVNLSENPFFF